MKNTSIYSIKRMIYCILICQIAGLLGSVFTFSGIPHWYEFLNKPSFTPPNWIFAPVWTFLYCLMGISFYFIYEIDHYTKLTQRALAAFFIQLGLNVTWSIVFFGLHSPILGLINIILLWMSILVTMILFFKLNKWSGILFIPYLLWVTYAFILNYSIVALN